MTRKDYQLIAETIGSLSPVLEQRQLDEVRDSFADMLTEDNERFDYGRFSDAVEAAAAQADQ